MMHISRILIDNPQLDSFEQLCALMPEFAARGERFLRFDVKPPFPDTPLDWEDRLEAAFSARN